MVCVACVCSVCVCVVCVGGRGWVGVGVGGGRGGGGSSVLLSFNYFNQLGFQAPAGTAAFVSLTCLVLSVRWLHVRTSDTIAQAVRVSNQLS